MEKRRALLECLIMYLIAPICGAVGTAMFFNRAVPIRTALPEESSVQTETTAPKEESSAEITKKPKKSKPVRVRLGDVYETMSDTEEIDLSFINLAGLDVDGFLDSMTGLRRVTMHGCGLDNEAYAALQDAHPDIKIVFDIYLKNYVVSTDAVGFSTLLANEEQPRLTNDDAKYFKYCTDMVALDLGHNHISDLSFLQYMPELRVLILADNCTKDGTVALSDISDLKYVPHLRYLELFANNISDLSPIAELEELEDLNICYNPFDTTKEIRHLPNLQRLWIYANYVPTEELAELSRKYYPNAVVVISGDGSIDQGWRESPHYYAMRNMVINNVIDDLYLDDFEKK